MLVQLDKVLLTIGYFYLILPTSYAENNRLPLIMLSFLGGFSRYVKFKTCLIDNATFRLHYQVGCK